MSLLRKVARPMLASIFLVQGVRTLLDPEPATARSKPMTDRIAPALQKRAPSMPTDARTLVRANAGIHVGAGALLATGTLPRLSSLVLAASLVPTTITGHAFWDEEDPDERDKERVAFLTNVGLAGGLLIAGLDTEGRPGLTWRATHAAGGSRRQVRHATREARLAARGARRSARLAKTGLASKMSR